MIHFVGDSHASIFSGCDEMQPRWPSVGEQRHPLFRGHRVGPYTAYNLQTKIDTIEQVLQTYVDKDHDYVFFVFGEVDCRNHLPVHNNTRMCVSRYVNTILTFRDKGYKIGIFGPHFNQPIVDGPFKGTTTQRMLITLQFNATLINKCVSYNIPFFHVLDTLLDEMGEIRTELYMPSGPPGNIHLGTAILPYIETKLRKIGVLK